MPGPVDIAVVVVGFNSREYSRACLRSLASTDWRDYSHAVVYIDNASSDGGVDMVRNEFPDVTTIANTHNEGFCRACNQGVAAIESRFVYLLNNDTELFPDSVHLLAAFLDQRREAGAAGNRLLNTDLSEQWSARRFPTWRNALLGRRSFLTRLFPNSSGARDYLYKDQLTNEQPFRVDWVPGSCTLVRREAYLRAGGLPEDMHYWSDAVFCDRLGRAGWHVYVVPKAKLIHHEGKGTGAKSGAVRRWLISDFHHGAYRFYCEHYGLGPWNPARWIARLGLGLRAYLLSLADWISNLKVTAFHGT